MLSLRTTLPKSSKMNGFVRPFAYVSRPARRISAGHRRAAGAPEWVDAVRERLGFTEREERVTSVSPLILASPRTPGLQDPD